MFSSFKIKELPLTKYEQPVYSTGSNWDQGIIAHILEVIKPETRYCIEFGAGNGGETLVVKDLIENQQFEALLIEGNPDYVAELSSTFENNPKVRTQQAFITAENIESLFEANQVPARPDFLLIDLDGNDYHIWHAIKNFHPRIVCIEYNASYPPPQQFVVDYDPELNWQFDDYHSASITSLTELARAKGYQLIHCNRKGENAFFVLNEYFPLFEISDNSPEHMYQLPQMGKFGRAINGKGHPASTRNTSAILRLFYRLRYYLAAFPRHLNKPNRTLNNQNK